MWCLQNVLHIWLLYAAEASNWKTMLCSLRSSHVPSPLPHCTVYCCWFSLCLFIPLMLYLSPSLPCTRYTLYPMSVNERKYYYFSNVFLGRNNWRNCGIGSLYCWFWKLHKMQLKTVCSVCCEWCVAGRPQLNAGMRIHTKFCPHRIWTHLVAHIYFIISTECAFCFCTKLNCMYETI